MKAQTKSVTIVKSNRTFTVEITNTTESGKKFKTSLQVTATRSWDDTKRVQKFSELFPTGKNGLQSEKKLRQAFIDWLKNAPVKKVANLLDTTEEKAAKWIEYATQTIEDVAPKAKAIQDKKAVYKAKKAKAPAKSKATKPKAKAKAAKSAKKSEPKAAKSQTTTKKVVKANPPSMIKSGNDTTFNRLLALAEQNSNILNKLVELA